MAKQKTRAELLMDLARVQRSENALCEWFLCSTRPDLRGNATASFDVTVDSRESVIRVQAMGLARAAGGVVVVSTENFNDFPVYLDDLVAIWSRDTSPEIRDAARKLVIARNRACEVSAPIAGECV